MRTPPGLRKQLFFSGFRLIGVLTFWLACRASAEPGPCPPKLVDVGGGHCCRPGQRWDQVCVGSPEANSWDELSAESQEQELARARREARDRPTPRRPPLPYVRSFLNLGGVGYLVPSDAAPSGISTSGPILGSFAGAGIDGLHIWPVFRQPGVDGGFGVGGGTDLAFVSGPGGLGLLSTAWFGAGFELAIGKYFQFGPRVGLGYAVAHAFASSGGSDITGIGGMLLVGGRATVWATRSFGFFFQADGAYLFPGGGPWLPRLSGGLAFGL